VGGGEVRQQRGWVEECVKGGWRKGRGGLWYEWVEEERKMSALREGLERGEGVGIRTGDLTIKFGKTLPRRSAL
jgi:hypothetical protein